MIEILIAFFVILELKVIRDIIAFRFEWSWLDRLPDWFKNWLRKPFYRSRLDLTRSFDGWHCADAGIIMVAWFLSWFFWAGDWAPGVITYPLFWVVFYQAFNFQYHWLWIRPMFRERWLFREFRK